MPEIDSKNILHILGEEIAPGSKKILNFNTAKLYTNTFVEVPIIIERSKRPGPVVLITGGMHGDEFNGVEIVRQIISKKINKPKRGTIICIPIMNVFGFLEMKREFPDGRDLNRVFPGFKKGSLPSRFAYHFVNEILPVANYCLDFHTGGAQRFNAAQVRLNKGNMESLELAKVFNAPFTVYSKLITKSYRETCYKMGIPSLIFEGGKTQDNDKNIAAYGVSGVMRVLQHLDMLRRKFEAAKAKEETIFIKSTHWMRANFSGLFHNKINIGQFVNKGEHIASITDPYGSFKRRVKAPYDGYVININQAPIVYKGDAIYHLSKEIGE